MLSGPRQKFCDGIVAGESATNAYAAAYPRASREAARKHAPRLVANGDIKSEIARQRGEAEKLAGSGVMNLVEKRIFLARVVRACVAKLEKNSDLWVSIKQTEDGTEYRLPDKLRAIALDNDLAGDGAEAGADDALAELLGRCMK